MPTVSSQQAPFCPSPTYQASFSPVLRPLHFRFHAPSVGPNRGRVRHLIILKDYKIP